MNSFAIIFDLDGTLIDSESLAHIAWERTLIHFDKQFTRAHEYIVLGIDLITAIENVRAHFDIVQSTEEVFQALSVEWNKLSANGLPTMPDVHPVLEALDEQGVIWGVATNSDHAYAVEHLTHVNLVERAAAIVGVDDVENGKPAPDVFVECARKIGFAPANCIAIEDSVVGHRAAAAAGMTVVVVGDGLNSADFPLAHHVFQSLPEFLDRLDQIAAALS